MPIDRRIDGPIGDCGQLQVHFEEETKSCLFFFCLLSDKRWNLSFLFLVEPINLCAKDPLLMESYLFHPRSPLPALKCFSSILCLLAH